MKNCRVGWCPLPGKHQGLCPTCYDRIRNQHNSGRETEVPFYPQYVPVSETNAVERVQEFFDAGYSHRMIHMVMGCENGFTVRLLKGKMDRISVDNLTRIEGTELIPVYELWKKDIGIDYLLPNYLAARRVKSLSVVGWSSREVAEEMGVNKAAISSITSAGKKRVKRSTLVELDAAYRRLSMTPSPSGVHALHPRIRKTVYPRPFEWNEGEIDLPDGEAAALERARHRYRNARKAETNRKRKQRIAEEQLRSA